jgi:hypothetical protein
MPERPTADLFPERPAVSGDAPTWPRRLVADGPAERDSELVDGPSELADGVSAHATAE